MINIICYIEDNWTGDIHNGNPDNLISLLRNTYLVRRCSEVITALILIIIVKTFPYSIFLYRLRICFLRTSYFLLSGSKEDNLSFILKNWGKTYQLLYGEDTEEKDKKCHLVQCRGSGRKSLVGFKDGGDLDHFCTNLSSNKLLLIFNKKCVSTSSLSTLSINSNVSSHRYITSHRSYILIWSTLLQFPVFWDS